MSAGVMAVAVERARKSLEDQLGAFPAYGTPYPGLNRYSYEGTYSAPGIAAALEEAERSSLERLKATMRDLMPPSYCDCPLCSIGRSWNVVPTARRAAAEARVKELERRVYLKHFPLEGKWWLVTSGGEPMLEDAIMIDLLLAVKDRDTGVPRSQAFSMRVPIMRWVDRNIEDVSRELARGLRRFLLEALEHEVDEAIHIETERVFDPHDFGRRIVKRHP